MPTKIRTCSVADCNGKHTARGYCQKHYKRAVKAGRLQTRGHVTPPGQAREYFELFMRDYRRGLLPSDQCLPWIYYVNRTGYGRLGSSGSAGGTRLAHRLVLEQVAGAAPGGKPLALHHCGNGHKACINPYHLYWGSPADNNRDMVEHGSSTRGVKHPQCKLTEKQVLEIYNDTSGRDVEEIAGDYRVSRTTIRDIRSGRTWAWRTKHNNNNNNNKI